MVPFSLHSSLVMVSTMIWNHRWEWLVWGEASIQTCFGVTSNPCVLHQPAVHSNVLASLFSLLNCISEAYKLNSEAEGLEWNKGTKDL